MPQYLPKEIKDLLSKMLVVNPAHRITLAGIMQHPWFLSNSASFTYTPFATLEDHVSYSWLCTVYFGRARHFISMKLIRSFSKLWSPWEWAPSRTFNFV